MIDEKICRKTNKKQSKEGRRRKGKKEKLINQKEKQQDVEKDKLKERL